MSPDLAPFLNRAVHVDCYGLDLCGNGELSVEASALVLSPQGLRIPLEDVTSVSSAVPEIEPPGSPDLCVYTEELVIRVFELLRSPDCHE